MTDPIKTGELIAARRKRFHMTQAQLAEKLMVSPQAVSKWESGQTLPDAALLPDLAAALFTSADYLLRGGPAEPEFTRAVRVEDLRPSADDPAPQAGVDIGHSAGIRRAGNGIHDPGVLFRLRPSDLRNGKEHERGSDRLAAERLHRQTG